MENSSRSRKDDYSEEDSKADVDENLASYPGSLIIAGEEKRAWFQSLTHALNLTC